MHQLLRVLCMMPAGTPNYLAPEMINCEPYNQKADIWAIGCLLYEMAALRPAFKVGTSCS